MSNAVPSTTPGPMRSAQIEATNGLGLAGFIVSLVGLLSCGLLSPIGLIMSFVALFKRPRGFALAGLVLGLVGSAWVIIAIVFGLFAVVLAGVGIKAAAVMMEADRAQAQLHKVHDAIVAYERDAGRLPSTLDLLPGVLPGDLADPWGTTIRYQPGEGASFTLTSDGPDRKGGTPDDIAFDASWTARPAMPRPSPEGEVESMPKQAV